MPSFRCQPLVAGLIWLGIGAAAASAQATFYEAYADGLGLAEAGRWNEARAALLRAVELRPEPGKNVRTYGLNFLDRYEPYLQLARVELGLGRLDEAAGHLREAGARGVAPEREIAALTDRLQRLREEAAAEAAAPVPPPAAPPPAPPPPVPPPRLRITSEPPGADLRVDGEALGRTPQTLETTAGEHLLELRLAGYHDRSVTVTARPSATTDQHFVLEKAPPPVPDSGRGSEPRGSPADDDSPGIRDREAPPPPSTAVEATVVPPAARPSGGAEEEVIEEGSEPAVRAPTAAPLATSPGPPAPGAAGDDGAGEAGAAGGGDPASPPGGMVAPGPGEPPAGGRELSRWPVWVTAAALLALLGVLGAWHRSRRREPGGVVSALLPAEDLEGAPTVRMSRAAPLPEGTRSDFGTYRLSGLLGVGGMARTFLGVRRRDGLPVAIKVPHEHLMTDGDSSERFLREGKLGATLHHPNIVRIYEAAEVGGRPFIAMELLAGETLEAALHREGALAVERALGVARGIAQALDYAHLKGVVHRDLKPDNVMLLSSGEVKVMDYGIARVLGSPGVTATGTYLGTPIYSSPESLRAKEVDHRSDLYSVGIILYHMLAGKVPFSSTDPLKLLMMHVSEPLPPLPDGLPPGVGEIVERLTAKSPGDRYPSAEILLRDLDRLLNSL